MFKFLSLLILTPALFIQSTRASYDVLTTEASGREVVTMVSGRIPVSQLRAHVTNELGQPVQGVAVLGDREFPLDGSGFADLGRRIEGPYRIVANAPGYNSSVIVHDLAQDNTVAEIVVTGGANLSAIIRNAAGQGIAGAQVSTGPSTQTANGDGFVNFGVVPRGSYQITASAPGYLAQTLSLNLLSDSTPLIVLQTAPQPITPVSLTTSPALPGSVGAPMTLTAHATGGIAPLQYQFWAYENGAWSPIGSYSTSNTATYTPRQSGAHMLVAWVKNGNSTAQYDSYVGVPWFDVPNVDRSVIGTVDGVQIFGGVQTLTGWACAKTSAQSINVQLLLGGPMGVGAVGATVTANLASDPSIAQACQTNGAAYRFQIPLTSYVSQFPNLPIYVYGVSPYGLPSAALTGSGSFRVPPAAPQNACRISQAVCPNYPTYVGSFDDNWNNSASSAAACLQRAADYYNWCGGSVRMGRYVTSATFWSGGNAIQSRSVGGQISGDFDGNGTADLTVFRPDSGVWFTYPGRAQQWGLAGDIPISMDIDGDRRPDYAVYRPSNGSWYWRTSSSGYAQGGAATYGAAEDIPVPGDYNGDGKDEIAVWRPSNGVWYLSAVGAFQWGLPGDKPVRADFDGDGRMDLAVYRPSNGYWYILTSSSNYTQSQTFGYGISTDIPVAGDYNGDGKAEIAVWRPSNGVWYINGVGQIQWGLPGDVPVPADFDGDGKLDLIVFRPSNGNWYILKSSSGYSQSTTQGWGIATDIPVIH